MKPKKRNGDPLMPSEIGKYLLGNDQIYSQERGWNLILNEAINRAEFLREPLDSITVASQKGWYRNERDGHVG